MKELMGNTYPGYIWQSYMQKIHEGLQDKEFTPYEDPRVPEEETGDDTDEGDEINRELADRENTEGEDVYTGTDEDTGFTGKLIYIGEDGSSIILSDEISEEDELDREGKPVYFDDEGNRYLYDENGSEVIVGADGYPDDYFMPGAWTLYDREGNPVMRKTKS